MPQCWSKVMHTGLIAPPQAESDEKALRGDDPSEEVSRLRAALQQTEERRQLLEHEVQTHASHVKELSILWGQKTRWKRALVFSALAPLEWAVGGVVLGTEILCRLLRKMKDRTAPMVAPKGTSRCSIIVLSWEGKDLLAQLLPPLLKAVRFLCGIEEGIVV